MDPSWCPRMSSRPDPEPLPRPSLRDQRLAPSGSCVRRPSRVRRSSSFGPHGDMGTRKRRADHTASFRQNRSAPAAPPSPPRGGGRRAPKGRVVVKKGPFGAARWLQPFGAFAPPSPPAREAGEPRRGEWLYQTGQARRLNAAPTSGPDWPGPGTCRERTPRPAGAGHGPTQAASARAADGTVSTRGNASEGSNWNSYEPRGRSVHLGAR